MYWPKAYDSSPSDILPHADRYASPTNSHGLIRAEIRNGLPETVFLGWKNFEDEDTPMLTPKQTVEQVHPTPHFISYQ